MHRGVNERAARPRLGAFRAATAAQTRRYKRWPKIERKLRDRYPLGQHSFKVFSGHFWLDRLVGIHVWLFYNMYTYIKAVREAPAHRLITKISNYIPVTETGTSSLHQICLELLIILIVITVFYTRRQRECSVKHLKHFSQLSNVICQIKSKL